MTTIIFLISFFVLITVSTMLLTRLVTKLLTYYAVVDQPEIRRLNVTTIPRGGGSAIFIVFVLSFVYLDQLYSYGYYTPIILPLLSLISIISFYDDIKTAPPLLRLSIHMIVAVATLILLLYPNLLFHDIVPSMFDLAIAVIVFTGFINIYNFLDGIDGITAFQTIHLSSTILLLTAISGDSIIHIVLIRSIAFILLACSIGFLKYNWSPATIILGDIGSIMLGFLMGLCLVLLAASSLKLFIACTIANLYYIVDGGGTILIRLFKGEKIWLPHLNHFFQQAVRKGMSHKQVVIKIACCNILLAILTVISLFYPIVSLVIAIIIVAHLITKLSYRF